MGTALTNASMKSVITGTETTGIGSTSRTMSLQPIAQANFANGTTTAAPPTAAKVASIVSSVTAGTPLNIDLTNLVAAGIDDPLSVTNIKGIIIQNTTSAGGGDLQVGDSAGTLTNAVGTNWFTTATTVIPIEAQGHEAMCRPNKGLPVDGTHKVLQLKASTGTVTFQIDMLLF